MTHRKDNEQLSDYLLRLGAALEAEQMGVPDPFAPATRLERGDAMLMANMGLRVVRSDEQRLVDGIAEADHAAMQADK